MNTLESTIHILAALVTIVGLPFLVASIFFLARQLRQQAYQGVYQSILSIDQFFTENPELIGYVLNGVPLPEDDPLLRDKAINAIGMFVDFFEHLVSQKSLLEKDVWKGWEVYIRDMYANNPAVQDYVKTNHRWYSDRLLNNLGFERSTV